MQEGRDKGALRTEEETCDAGGGRGCGPHNGVKGRVGEAAQDCEAHKDGQVREGRDL